MDRWMLMNTQRIPAALQGTLQCRHSCELQRKLHHGLLCIITRCRWVSAHLSTCTAPSYAETPSHSCRTVTAPRLEPETASVLCSTAPWPGLGLSIPWCVASQLHNCFRMATAAIPAQWQRSVVGHRKVFPHQRPVTWAMLHSCPRPLWASSAWVVDSCGARCKPLHR